MRAKPLGLLTMIIFLLLAACASSPPSPPAQDKDSNVQAHVFPQPGGLNSQVDFWRNVFALWSRRQVVLHDSNHLNLVYTVIELPGEVDLHGRYTPSQRTLVKTNRQDLEVKLQELEDTLSNVAELNAEQQRLFDYIAAKAGPAAITGASERLRSQRGLRERFKRGLEISGRYDALFRAIFKQAGLPEDLAYLPHVESSFQTNAHSSAGAVGVWQFTRGAAKTYMTDHPALDERYDPVASAQGAARYLHDAYDVLGDWSLAVTSYNHGIGGMKRARRYFGNDFMAIVRNYDHPYFGFASRNFYAEFLAAREVAREPERFFPEGIAYQAPLDWDRLVLQQPMLASELAATFDIQFDRLVAMNTAWTKVAVRNKVALPVGTQVWLPAGTLPDIAVIGSANGPSALAIVASSRSHEWSE